MSWMVKALLLSIILLSHVSAKTIDQHIHHFSEQISIGEDVTMLGEIIHAEGIVPLYYQQRQFRPAWTDLNQAKRIVAEIKTSEDEGLSRNDYHYDALLELIVKIESRPNNENFLRAKLDMLLTDGIMIYAFHLINGKVDPSSMEKAWNYAHTELLPDDVIASLTNSVNNGTVVEDLEALKPQPNMYRVLKKGLGKYRDLAAKHDFELVDDSVVLRLGMDHPNVAALRVRLAQEGYQASATSSPSVFDEGLKAAVFDFQELHGIDADGVVGQRSFDEINVSYASRANQLRVNLDRTRWVVDDVDEDFVLVNIAGYTLYFVRNKEVIWKTDVMIGTDRHETPTFKSTIRYMVFNPTWTVPRSILRRSLINKFKADPNYAIEHGFTLVDREGQHADLTTIDWTQLSPNNFPYTVVQQPSAENALGQVKFMFPNEHAIYLHDTPAKSLFSRTQRAFSSGCVRVKEPFEFARLLLDDEPQWSPQSIDDVVQARELKHVSLTKPIDVLLMYWTAEPTDDGRIKFNTDVYNRDAAVLAKLDESLN